MVAGPNGGRDLGKRQEMVRFQTCHADMNYVYLGQIRSGKQCTQQVTKQGGG